MAIFQRILPLRSLCKGGVFAIMLFAFGAAPNIVSAQAKPGKENMDCVPVGSWITPGGGRISGTEGIARAAKRSVVLLGEMHDNAEHHRWQLQTLAALHAARPDMIIGFEMFPRRVQKALDRWVAGELSEAEFLAASDWNAVWSTDANLYLPLFHFARMNRVPMVALNIDTRLRRAVSAKGFDGVPENEREGVMSPAAPSTAYLDYLLPIYDEHERSGKKKGEAGSRDDPDFRRFVEGQQLWDGAMAQAIRSALDRPGRPLVVGIMGSGHIKYGYGVPHQLKDLGVNEVATLLPWNSGTACGQIVAGIADAVFGVALPSPVSSEPPRQRLGIRFEMAQDGGARVLQVEKGSIAETAGIRDSDVIREAAGMPIKQTNDIVEIVKRQAPGTLLPLKLKRGGETIEINARFSVVSK
ncbi:MAG: ChaN family lipoprotein [Pseudomonadota bacterium]|nr:ChaN family lipoprotein [Pseudomonadota bacterium]